jgi:hypothetical protein
MHRVVYTPPRSPLNSGQLFDMAHRGCVRSAQHGASDGGPGLQIASFWRPTLEPDY